MENVNKTLNNRFQGTLHKVSGPLNRDVQIDNAAYKWLNGPAAA